LVVNSAGSSFTASLPWGRPDPVGLDEAVGVACVTVDVLSPPQAATLIANAAATPSAVAPILVFLLVISVSLRIRPTSTGWWTCRCQV
jgi:hypothetical protein